MHPSGMLPENGSWVTENRSLLKRLAWKWLELPWVRFSRRVAILWGWLPIIWNDYHWDYSQILKVLQYKLEQSHKEYGKYSYAGKELKHLRTCILLLDRLVKDDYWQVNPDQECCAVTYNEFKGKIDLEQSRKEQDMALFCKLFSKHYNRWWT